MSDEQEFREDKRAYLQLIQGVTNRMGGNLFYLKGWAVTVFAALLALSLALLKGKYQLTVVVPVVIFWILDAYFLSLERCYRSLYDEVRAQKYDGKDLDFDLNPTPYKRFAANTIWAAAFRPTVFWFYSGIIVTMLLIIGLTK